MRWRGMSRSWHDHAGRLRSCGAARKWQQGDVACPLDGHAQPALMTRANARHPPRQNLATLLHELRQDVRAFVVDEVHLLDAELANLLLAKNPAAPPGAAPGAPPPPPRRVLLRAAAPRARRPDRRDLRHDRLHAAELRRALTLVSVLLPYLPPFHSSPRHCRGQSAGEPGRADVTLLDSKNSFGERRTSY